MNGSRKLTRFRVLVSVVVVRIGLVFFRTILCAGDGVSLVAVIFCCLLRLKEKCLCTSRVFAYLFRGAIVFFLAGITSILVIFSSGFRFLSSLRILCSCWFFSSTLFLRVIITFARLGVLVTIFIFFWLCFCSVGILFLVSLQILKFALLGGTYNSGRLVNFRSFLQHLL